MSDVKLCKDCRYFEAGGIGFCHHPNALRLDRVNGTEPQYASAMRAVNGDCGGRYCAEVASWFEPKVILGDVA